MVKLKHHTFESHCAAVDQSCIINMDCHGGRPTHTQFSEVKDEEYSCNVVMMEAYGKGPSNKELNIRSLELECQKQEPCAGAAADNCAIRKPLQKVCSSIWRGKRTEVFSFSFSEVTDTRPKKKKNHTPKKILYTSFPVFCFCGTLTVTHSHWVNKLQSLNCILEQGTSKSYNRTGLDGKTGINLTSVHRFVWCLYIAFLFFTPGPPSLPHTIPIPFQLWFRAQPTPLWNSLSLRP